MNDLTPQADHRLDLSTDTADTCIKRIHAIHDDYHAHSRTVADIPGLLVRRMDLIGLRQHLLQQFAVQPPAWSRDDRFHFLAGLAVYVPQRLRPAIGAALGADLFAQLMAQQGVRVKGFSQHAPAAGPDKHIPILANKNSRWPFSRWNQHAEFSQYLYLEGKVHYRNIDFMPGDVLLTNTNRDGNGIFTCVSEPFGHFPHSGFFAILEDKGQCYPGVIETYRYGVRAVPLSVFLHPAFSSYVEVYRHRQVTMEHAAAINSCGYSLMEQAKGYNFDTEDDDRRFISCSTIGRFMLEDAGLAPPSQRSWFLPTAQENLQRIGYRQMSPLFPVDYMTDRNFQCVGHVDNNHFVRLSARLLVERELSYQFTRYQLDPDRFPAHTKLNLWAIQQIRRQTALAGVVQLVSGYDQWTLPRGPDPLLAHITVAEQQLAKQIRRTDTALLSYFANHSKGREPPSTAQLLRDEQVLSQVRQGVNLPWLHGN